MRAEPRWTSTNESGELWCRNYKFGEYDRCLEEEYSRQFIEIINCTLPWVSDKHPLWCRNNLNISASKMGRVNNLIDKILDDIEEKKGISSKPRSKTEVIPPKTDE